MVSGRNSEMQSSIVEFGELETNVQSASCSSNACTINGPVGKVTTESLSTASAGSQAITVNNTSVLATDLAFVQWAGGTNTKIDLDFIAVCTAGVLTVTIKNNNAAALDGTIIFNFLVVHARPGNVF